MVQSPEDYAKAQILGMKDFLILLGGGIIGQLVAAADSLSIGNALIGIPVGLFATTKYVKSALMKQLLMGFGLGMTLQGTSEVFSPTIAKMVDDAFKSVGLTSFRQSVQDTIDKMMSGFAGITGVAVPTTVSVPNVSLEGVGGYAF